MSPLSQNVTITTTDVAGINFIAIAPVIGRTNWKIIYFDSQETVCGNYAAVNAIDGNVNSFWHTQYCGATPGMPHEIQIDLGATYAISGFQYLPRQDGGTNGDVNAYNFFVSTDGTNWNPVSSGNLITAASDHSLKQVTFPSFTGRYVRFQALSDVNSSPYANVTELNVLGH